MAKLKKCIKTTINQSVLYHLLLEDMISQKEFDAGVDFIKLYLLSMRSQGIKNRVRSSCQNWEQLYGITYDGFCSYKIESTWRKILHCAAPFYHRGLPVKKILFELIHSNSQPITYSPYSVKYVLNFLIDFWDNQ